MKNKKLQKVVKTMLNNFERQERELENGNKKTWLSFKLDFIIGKSKEYEVLSEAMRDIQTDDNTLYQGLFDCLEWLDQELEAKPNEKARLEDFDYYGFIEGNNPIYTSDLTEWLNASNHNVYYLTQALGEYDLKDGFQVLTQAYCLAQYDIFESLISAINTDYLNA